MKPPICVTKSYKHKMREDFIPTFRKPVKSMTDTAMAVCEARGKTVLLSLGEIKYYWDEVTCIHCKKIKLFDRLSD